MRKHTNCRGLYIELQSIESRGIMLFLEGEKSSSQEVAEALKVNEDGAYMRDYIFDEGVLKELHFDRINMINEE